MAPDESVPLEEAWMVGVGVQRKMEPPSKGTTLMYDYTVVLLEPLHRSSQSLSLLLSIKAHFAAKSSIFHLMSFLTLLFFSNLSAISVNCAAGGLGLFWSVFLEPNIINGTCACCAIIRRNLTVLPLLLGFSSSVGSTSSFLCFLYPCWGKMSSTIFRTKSSCDRTAFCINWTLFLFDRVTDWLMLFFFSLNWNGCG